MARNTQSGNVKPQIGDVVHIVFLDHAENSEDAIRFEVIGRLFEKTRWAYKVRCWGYVNDVDRAGDSRTDNENWFSIVKKAVESIKVLK